MRRKLTFLNQINPTTQVQTKIQTNAHPVVTAVSNSSRSLPRHKKTRTKIVPHKNHAGGQVTRTKIVQVTPCGSQ
jgi:hypothetical protein